MSDVRNLIIVGSGPAGYTAAVYAARAQLNPLVFEGSVTAGGALMNTTDVENYPGFADGIMGPQLMEEMRKQAERFGAEVVTDDVTSVDLNGDIKTVTDGSGNTHSAHAVVLAMGSGYRGGLVWRTRSVCRGTGFPGARPATASSSGNKILLSSVVETRLRRKQPFSPVSRTRFTSSTGAMSCVPAR